MANTWMAAPTGVRLLVAASPRVSGLSSSVGFVNGGMLMTVTGSGLLSVTLPVSSAVTVIVTVTGSLTGAVTATVTGSVSGTGIRPAVPVTGTVY